MTLSSMFQSKLARRLVRLFVLIIAVPLIVTALTMARLGKEQVVWLAYTMEAINQSAVKDAALKFQNLGRDAVRQSSRQTETTSISAINSVSAKLGHIQSESLSKTTRALSKLTSSSFEGATRQSVSTHHAMLGHIRSHVTALALRSAQETQKQAAGNIERAMLALHATLMQQRAEQLAVEMADHLQDAPIFMQFTAQMPDMRDGNIAGQKATLDALVRRLPDFLSVAALDKTGHETAKAASDRLITSADLGQCDKEKYFQQAMQGTTFVAMDPEPHNGAPVMQFAVPIEAYRGKIVGVVAARFSLESLWETIRNTRIGKEGFAYVIDGHRKPLLAPKIENSDLLRASAEVAGVDWQVIVSVPRSEAMQPIQALKLDISRNAREATVQMQRDMQRAARNADIHLQSASLTVRDKALKQMRARFTQATESVKQTTGQHTTQELAHMRKIIQEQTQSTQKRTDWQMTQAEEAASRQLTMSIQPLTERAMKRADARLTLAALISMLVFCLLGCLIALFTASRIVLPVLRLASVTRSIANGELDKRVDERAPDEIGDLAVAFNTMAASLQQSRDSLHEAEAQLVQSAKLASLGTLSAGVAHELNQPVAIIRGLAQQLQDEPGLNEDILADLQLIEGQTSRMTKIIKHLRTFCRAGSEEKTRFDIHDVIQNCLMFVGAQLQAHNIGVTLQLGEGTAEVIGDANELEQVFLNLITNARDAMEGRMDGNITIRTHVGATQVCIEFEDNGTGIPEHIMSHIFDPFFTTKDPGKGTGLGLSISHSILKKHQGNIQVTNNPGALFTILLPCANATLCLDAETEEARKAA